MNQFARQKAVRPREVDMLEDAARRDALAVRFAAIYATQPLLVYQHRLARLHIALESRADMVERAGLRRQHPAAVQLADAERAHAQRVAHADELGIGHYREGIRALQPPHAVGDALFPRERGRVGKEMRDDFGVVAAVKIAAPAGELFFQRHRVDEIAIVRQRELDSIALGADGLRVLYGAIAGRGIARMPDGDMPRQVRHIVLLKRLPDQPHRDLGMDARAIACGDAGALLPAVLQRVQPEESVARGVVAPRIYAHNPALFARRVVCGKRRGVGIVRVAVHHSTPLARPVIDAPG